MEQQTLPGCLKIGRPECVTFDYGQRHYKEIEAAEAMCKAVDVPWQLVDLRGLLGGLSSALTDLTKSVSETNPESGLPATFVPGRNIVFLSLAASLALSRGMNHVVTGVCQTDYSGYPDCRRETIDFLEETLNLGNAGFLKERIMIHTPLMNLTKAQTVQMAHDDETTWKLVGMSWTCYAGGEKPCGECPACKLRIKGFAETGFPDPALGG